MDQPEVFYIGLDGGGTGSRIRVRRQRGEVVFEAEGGPANVHLARDAALSNIHDLVHQAVIAVSSPHPSRLRVGLGLAGAATAGVRELLPRFLPDWPHVFLASDAETACLGAHGGQDGGLVIAGTGSIALARLHEETTLIGGRGFMLSDDGSGARMGLDALRQVLRAHDGLRVPSNLCTTLMARFDHDPRTMVQWANTAQSNGFAALMPDIIQAGVAKDPIALDVLGSGGRALGELIDAVKRKGATRISLVGGLAEAMRPYLPEPSRDSLSPPIADARDGAMMLAGWNPSREASP